MFGGKIVSAGSDSECRGALPDGGGNVLLEEQGVPLPEGNAANDRVNQAIRPLSRSAKSSCGESSLPCCEGSKVLEREASVAPLSSTRAVLLSPSFGFHRGPAPGTLSCPEITCQAVDRDSIGGAEVTKRVNSGLGKALGLTSMSLREPRPAVGDPPKRGRRRRRIGEALSSDSASDLELADGVCLNSCEICRVNIEMKLTVPESSPVTTASTQSTRGRTERHGGDCKSRNNSTRSSVVKKPIANVAVTWGYDVR